MSCFPLLWLLPECLILNSLGNIVSLFETFQTEMDPAFQVNAWKAKLAAGDKAKQVQEEDTQRQSAKSKTRCVL